MTYLCNALASLDLSNANLALVAAVGVIVACGLVVALGKLAQG